MSRKHKLDYFNDTFDHEDTESYWWVCPRCNRRNDEGEFWEGLESNMTERVECQGCKRVYDITLHGDWSWSAGRATLVEATNEA